MSGENVKLYRQGINAFNRRDLDAFLALAHPEVVGVSRVLAVEDGSFCAIGPTAKEAPRLLKEFVWQVSEWRDGQVVRWQLYESERDALEAAGIEE